MLIFENRSGAYFWYVSTGSAENRYSQASLSEQATVEELSFKWNG